MSRVTVLIEVATPHPNDAFSKYRAAAESESESIEQSDSLIQNLSGYGIELQENYPPVPMFPSQTINDQQKGFATFATEEENSDVSASSVVLAVWVDDSKIDELRARPDVRVWPNSELTYCGIGQESDQQTTKLDLSLTDIQVDCEPFRPAVTIDVIQDLLGVESVWGAGFRGQNIVVGIPDSGINGDVYPVAGGFSPSPALPIGGAAITSHGCMCAADVLVAAPDVTLFDYPFIDIPNSGGALRAFQAVLSHRHASGKPHILSNSFSHTERPPRQLNPLHEVWNINHPINRKAVEIVATGAAMFFAAGNCGAQCPQPECKSSSIGPGASISASNSLKEVITVAAVNSQHGRPGYSSQGPGGFEAAKPDISAYTHFFGNFGPGRPGGTGPRPFDRGTSAATPLAAGVAALLLSARPGLKPDQIKRIFIASATKIGVGGWNADIGFGVVNAARAFSMLG